MLERCMLSILPFLLFLVSPLGSLMIVVAGFLLCKLSKVYSKHSISAVFFPNMIPFLSFSPLFTDGFKRGDVVGLTFIFAYQYVCCVDSICADSF